MQKKYRGISLCSGILGFELGMCIAKLNKYIETEQCVEINKYCQDIIKLRLPTTRLWDDLTTYDPTEYGYQPDNTIMWSGFPCQPVSGAGKQKGDKDKRYLWPYILKLIRQIRPICWLGENVDGLRTINDGRLFQSILWQLSESGYCVEWSCVSAEEVGAVHRRERIWIIAYRPEAVITDANSIGCDCRSSIEPEYRDLLHSEWDASQNQQSRHRWVCGIDKVCASNVTNAYSTTSAMEEYRNSRQEWEHANASQSKILRQNNETPSTERNRASNCISTNTDCDQQQGEWCDSNATARTNIAFVGSSSKSEFSNANSTGLEGGRQSAFSAFPDTSIRHKNAESILCRNDDGISAELDRYLLRHDKLGEWLGASTISTFVRLSSDEVRSLSPEDQKEYKQLYKQYQRQKREYEGWLEALGNTVCPHQAAVAWTRVGQILGLFS